MALIFFLEKFNNLKNEIASGGHKFYYENEKKKFGKVKRFLSWSLIVKENNINFTQYTRTNKLTGQGYTYRGTS
jgi:hypothetical protein